MNMKREKHFTVLIVKVWIILLKTTTRMNLKVGKYKCQKRHVFVRVNLYICFFGWYISFS